MAQRIKLQTYLANECRRLSGQESLSLTKLLSSALSDNARVAAPLFLYAYVKGVSDRLVAKAQGTKLEEDYRAMLSILDSTTLEDVLDSNVILTKLPREYAKHLTSWKAAYNSPEIRNEEKERYRNRIRTTMTEKGITQQTLCAELSLNPGNLSSFLGKGQLHKLSREKCIAIMRYLAQH